MKTITVLLACVLCYFSGICQTFTDTLNINNNQVRLELTNTKVEFQLMPSYDSLVLTGKQLKEIRDQKIKIRNFKADTIPLSNGKKKVIFKFTIKQLKINCLEIKNAPAFCIFTIPKYSPKEKPRLGIQYFSEHIRSPIGMSQPSARIVNTQLLIENIPTTYRVSSCSTSPPATSTQSNLNQLKEIKLIACSTDPSVLQKKSTIREYLETDLSLSNITEETNIPPPQKAVDRIKNGITIRYFDKATQVHSHDLENQLKTISQVQGDTFTIENMLTSYNYSPIANYLEIWIK